MKTKIDSLTKYMAIREGNMRAWCYENDKTWRISETKPTEEVVATVTVKTHKEKRNSWQKARGYKIVSVSELTVSVRVGWRDEEFTLPPITINKGEAMALRELMSYRTDWLLKETQYEMEAKLRKLGVSDTSFYCYAKETRKQTLIRYYRLLKEIEK